jgi:aspartate/methionine/tyrosine aminotransferase
MFSRIASQLRGETNPLYALRDELRAEGIPILDLVSGNVNEHGILFPQALLENLLIEGARTAAVYKPDSLGQLPARAAISEYYGSRGIVVPPENLVLTPGTSIAYWYCFRLIADTEDEILCPTPSYPLFDYIALLSGARLVPYRLEEKRGWQIDLDVLENCISTHTRAIALISPHNPTGHVASTEELAALSELASRHDLAIISDEVFSEFLLDGPHLPRAAGTGAPLVFTLNGFSKMFALPGLKLGWMGVSGDPARVRRAMSALELISDTFLPVNEVIQAAVPRLLREGESFRQGYAAEIRARWREARTFLKPASRISLHEPQGGFYVTLALNGRDEEEAAQALLRKERLLIHPGYFYDMKPHHLVLSFVQEPALIREVYPRLVAALNT